MIVDAARAAFFVLLVMMTAFLLSGCDNSSGGGGDSDSGSLEIELSPENIAVDNLAFLSVAIEDAEFDDLNTQGLTLKLLIPEELGLVDDSLSLTLESGAIPITPLTIVEAPRELVIAVLRESGAEVDDLTPPGNFLMYVFPISPTRLKPEDDAGTLQATFEVNGVPGTPVLFADIDRVAVSSFDIENADFDPEAMEEFEVTPKIAPPE